MRASVPTSPPISRTRASRRNAARHAEGKALSGRVGTRRARRWHNRGIADAPSRPHPKHTRRFLSQPADRSRREALLGAVGLAAAPSLALAAEAPAAPPP